MSCIKSAPHFHSQSPLFVLGFDRRIIVCLLYFIRPNNLNTKQTLTATLLLLQHTKQTFTTHYCYTTITATTNLPYRSSGTTVFIATVIMLLIQLKQYDNRSHY
jgi:hypothetical protein